MRGSAFRGYRGRKPGNPSCRNKQARLQDKHALFGPESFMKAVAATEDRQEFDQLMAPPKQPRQTSKQQKARHKSWRCSKSFFHPEDRPFAEHPTSAEHSTSAENNVAPTTPAPLLAAWICPSYPKSLPLASSSTGVTSRVGSNNSSKSLTSLDQTEYQPSRRAAADQNPFMLLDLVPEAAQYSQPDSFAQKRSTKIPLTLRDTVAASTVSAENISTNTVTSFEQGTSAEHQSAIADLDGHHPDISAKKATVVSVAATGNARKYDIPILKRLQPAHGGTGLHLAQKAALRMQYFLVPGPQSLFAYRAISVKHANSTAPHFLDQAQQPDHWETSTEIPADSAGDITASVDATEDDKEDSFMETESAKTIYEDENTADKARKGDTAEWAMTQNVALELEKDILQEETKEVIVDPFRWLLPANFQDAGSLHKR